MFIEAALLLSLGPTDAPMKCPNALTLPGIDEGAYAMVVDSRIVGSDRDTDVLDPDTPVEVVEVTCWDPETDRMHADSGVRLMNFVTREHAALATDAMADFVAARAAFVDVEGVEPASLDALADHGLEDRARFDFQAVEGAWTVTTREAQAFRCTLSSSDLGDAEPDCGVDYRATKRNLRERWERGGM